LKSSRNTRKAAPFERLLLLCGARSALPQT